MDSPGFFAMKRWSLGTYHGLRRKHADTYLNEFVFRDNRRFYRMFIRNIAGLAAHHEPASYWDIIKRDNPRKGAEPPTSRHIDEPDEREKPHPRALPLHGPLALGCPVT